LRGTPPIFLSLALILSACADLPDVSATISPTAQATAYPELIPLAPLLATLPPPGDTPDLPQGRAAPPAQPTDLDTRTENLQSQADALRNAAL